MAFNVECNDKKVSLNGSFDRCLKFVKGIPGRRWQKAKKSWYVPLTSTQLIDAWEKQFNKKPTKQIDYDNVTLNPRQKAIVDHVLGLRTLDHTMVNADAGTGKSFTIKALAHKLQKANKSYLIVAYNSPIKDDMRSEGFKAHSFHSLGLSMLRQAWGKVNIDASKLWKIYTRLFPDKEDKPFYSPCAKLVSYCKNLMLEPSPENLADISLEFDVQFKTEHESLIYDRTKHLYNASIEDTSIIDYDDMVFLPILYNFTPYHVDYLLVDEYQDINPSRLALIQLYDHTTQLVMVGDSKQAINGWNGAFNDGMQKGQEIYNAVTFPLDITYRNEQPILDHVKSKAPYVNTETAVKTVTKGGGIFNYNEDEILPVLKNDDMIICAHNAPLMKLAFNLMQEGKPINIKGLELDKNLVYFMESQLNLKQDLSNLETSIDYILEKYAKASPMAKENITDKINIVRFFAGIADDLDHAIRLIYDVCNQDSTIIGSSIHRAKGLEANRVFILHPHLLPETLIENDETQASNIAYVALTRAKHTLAYVHKVN